MIIELGSCSIRAGLLTMNPSLPQVFFPTLALIKSNGVIVVGADAFIVMVFPFNGKIRINLIFSFKEIYRILKSKNSGCKIMIGPLFNVCRHLIN